MLNIIKGKHLLCDNSFVHAYFNESDSNHLSVINKIDELLSVDKKFVLSANTLFELRASISRRLINESYKGKKGRSFHFDFLSLDEEIINKCFDLKIFEKFPLLRGMDLINACLSNLLEIPLVTCDKDFEKYNTIIQVILL